MKLIHRCANGVEASIIKNALLEASIQSFEGEQGTSSIYPLPNFGPVIYVKAEDAEKALGIIKQLELDGQESANTESFHDVDKKEIAYLKSLNEKKGIPLWIWLTFGASIIGLIWMNLKKEPINQMDGEYNFLRESNTMGNEQDVSCALVRYSLCIG